MGLIHRVTFKAINYHYRASETLFNICLFLFPEECLFSNDMMSEFLELDLLDDLFKDYAAG